MLLLDLAGLAVTCAGPEALEALNKVLLAGVSFVEFVFPLARRAVELDEGLVLAHCLLVSAHLTFILSGANNKFYPSSRDICNCPVSILPPVLKVWSSVEEDNSKCHNIFSPPVSGHVRVAKAALEGGGLTEREERHVKALLAYAEGQLPAAIDQWAAILVKHPRDLLATHVMFVSCKMLGRFTRGRDVLAAILPHWEKTDPLFPYLLAL